MSDQNPPREEDLESHRAVPPPQDTANVARPDWLVGPDEGAASEVQRNAEGKTAGGPQLVRPGLPASPSEAPQKKPAKPVAWTGAASSVPTIRKKDSEEVPETARSAARHPVAIRETGPPPVSELDGELDDVEHSGPQDSLGDEFPMDDVAGAASGSGVGRQRPPVTVYREPWWVVAMDALRSNRVIQAVIVLGVIGFIVWKMWPSEVPTLAISKIHANPAGYDGHTVELRGNVGEVFPVGGGYAFYLHQGRDTIVVFTRSRVPSPREKVSVLGSISTGYLDGVARPALFEETAP